MLKVAHPAQKYFPHWQKYCRYPRTLRVSLRMVMKVYSVDTPMTCSPVNSRSLTLFLRGRVYSESQLMGIFLSPDKRIEILKRIKDQREKPENSVGKNLVQ